MGIENGIFTKASFQFVKSGRARYYSHHDLMRLVERATRKAGLPLKLTAGFNPRPRIVFPHALGVGVSSTCEEVELEFSQAIEPGKAAKLLGSALEPVLKVVGYKRLMPVKKGRVVSGSTYRICGWADLPILEQAVADLLASDSVIVERNTGKGRKAVDMRELLVSAELDEDVLVIRLKHCNVGAGRADEVARWLAKKTGESEFDLEIERIAVDF